MSGSIRLSDKHGVNPSMICCLWCGETKGIALVGRLPDDKEAPRQMVVDYEPCDACVEKMALGFTLMGVTDTPQQPNTSQPPITHDDRGKPLYPTGSYIVITNEAASRFFDCTNPNEAEILSKGKAFIDQSALLAINEAHSTSTT